MEVKVTCVGLKRLQAGGLTQVCFEATVSEIGRVVLPPMCLYLAGPEPSFVPGRDYLLKLEEMPK